MTAPRFIDGRDLKEGDRVKTWFMPGGTLVLCAEPYTGPLAYLWPHGARIVTFASRTPSGATPMTVPNDALLEVAEVLS